MTIITQASPVTAEKTTSEDRAAYVAYIRAAIALASTTSTQDRIKRDLDYGADRTTEGIARRAEQHRRTLELFRTAERRFLEGVTS